MYFFYYNHLSGFVLSLTKFTFCLHFTHDMNAIGWTKALIQKGSMALERKDRELVDESVCDSIPFVCVAYCANVVVYVCTAE